MGFVFQWIAIPFALLHPAVTSLGESLYSPESWLGEIHPDHSIGLYIDLILSVTFGTVPWQVSARTRYKHIRQYTIGIIMVHWAVIFHGITGRMPANTPLDL